jgi:lysophospholipase L1-like esterase
MPLRLFRLCLAPLLVFAIGSCRDPSLRPQEAEDAEAASIAPADDRVRERVVPGLNRITGSPRALAALQARWRERESRPFVVAHFGDSHVHNGHLPDAARIELQRIGGDGGRGMIFPYAIANSYSQNDYSSRFTGTWRSGHSAQQPQRLPVGVSGFVGQTSDALASFAFDFTRRIAPGRMRVRVFYRMTAPAATLSLSTAGYGQRVSLAHTPAGVLAHVDIMVPAVGSTLAFIVSNPSGLPAAPSDQGGAGSEGAPLPFDPTIAIGGFELHGVSLERPGPAVLYHNLGVGGAGFSALTQQRYFTAQIGRIAPDLIILDWGTNDIAFQNLVPAHFERMVLASIARIRRRAPDAVIMLSAAQDMKLQGRTITAAAELSALLRRIAAERDILFYDWYAIAGGNGSMGAWVSAGLGRPDNVHLSNAGYRLKGQLLGEALVEALSVPAPKQ